LLLPGAVEEKNLRKMKQRVHSGVRLRMNLETEQKSVSKKGRVAVPGKGIQRRESFLYVIGVLRGVGGQVNGETKDILNNEEEVGADLGRPLLRKKSQLLEKEKKTKKKKKKKKEGLKI